MKNQLVQSIPDPTTTNDLFLAESGNTSSGGPSVHDEATLRHDIQRTLTTLQDLVTTQLQPAAEKTGNHSSSLLVKRYREILFDLSGDFEKSRQSHNRKMERQKLMEGAVGRKKSPLEVDDAGMSELMRERNHISNSQSAAAAAMASAADKPDKPPPTMTIRLRVARDLSFTLLSLPLPTQIGRAHV